MIQYAFMDRLLGWGFHNREISEPAEWTNWLRKTQTNFKGDFDVAGVLLGAYSEGRDWMIEQFASRRLKFKKPQIGIEGKGEEKLFMYDGKIYVGKRWLEKVSQSDIHKKVTYMSARGDEVAYIGSRFDLLRIGGVEETHHYVYEKVGRMTLDDSQDLDITAAEYFSKAHEYLPLKWEIKFAESKGISTETISIMREHLLIAEKARRGK